MFERKILRKIFGPTKEDNGNWRIKTNIELDELIKHGNIINYEGWNFNSGNYLFTTDTK